jgi:general secretion pathway protein K
MCWLTIRVKRNGWGGLSACRTRRRAGSALLAVLWLSAALAAIAFAVANSVRAESERASTYSEGVRAYYLAAGAVDRALLYMDWGVGHRNPDGSPRYYVSGMARLQFSFPTGEALVEIIPETAKMDVNASPPADLMRLLLAAGASMDRAQTIVQAIVDWRTAAPSGLPTLFDQHYLSLTPSFRARHASFEEIEELLLVRGMTPDLFYGGYHSEPDGRLLPHGGLRDCLSVYGATSQFDVNTAESVLLAAVGLSPAQVSAVIEARNRMPFRDARQLAMFGPMAARLRVGGEDTFTLRATARVRVADGQLSDSRRSVAALMQFLPAGYQDRYHILRWYDDVWVR